jgi:small subunit ribosomal protein S6
MRPYEVMIIFDPALEEPVIRDQVDRSTELIRTGAGEPGRVDRWGKRRLAYEINHQREGYYVVVEATAEPATMADLDRALHLADEVLRHKVIRVPDRVAARGDRSAPPPGEPEPSSAPVAARQAASGIAARQAASGIAAGEAASGTGTSANGA